MTKRARGNRGQATTETLLTLMFVCLLVFGLVQFCLLGATRHVVDLAAFSAARTSMVRGYDEVHVNTGIPWPLSEIIPPEITIGIPSNVRTYVGWFAAWQRIRTIHWWNNDFYNIPGFLEHPTVDGRPGLAVSYRVPLGFPIFDADDGVVVRGSVPLLLQSQSYNWNLGGDGSSEGGDNADR